MRVATLRPPSCDRDPSQCRISSLGGTSTAVAWSPTYDGDGKRTDAGDPNIHIEEWRCGTCRKRWATSTRYDQTTIIKTWSEEG